MGSVDRYANLGVEFNWVKNYFKLKDSFWDSNHGLGRNMIKSLKAFLSDSGVTESGKISAFGHIVTNMDVDDACPWALMLCNLAYTSQFDWWIKNIEFERYYDLESIRVMLPESMSHNSRLHVVSAFKNIFGSNHVLAKEIGIGNCDVESKNGKRVLKTVYRIPWENPDPRVILYSLYKFAEACDGYYQFTLTSLMDRGIERSGVSPAELFGLDRDTMQKILMALSVNHPDFINASFTLDLDTITMSSEKSAMDVLELFE